MVDLGAWATDTISGFTGVVTARVEYLSGVVRYEITPRWEKGKPLEYGWFDEKNVCQYSEAEYEEMLKELV